MFIHPETANAVLLSSRCNNGDTSSKYGNLDKVMRGNGQNTQLNGFVDRSIQTVKRTLQKAKESPNESAKPCHDLNYSPPPCELLYTRKLNGDLDKQILN